MCRAGGRRSRAGRLLVEKSGYFGGSTARSGGGVWMPGNYAARGGRQVSADDLAQAKLYLDSIVGDVVPEGPPRHLPRPRPRGPRLHPASTPRCASSGSRSTPTTTPRRPAAAPPGRSCEPVPLDARFLGDELDRLHPQYTKAPANMIVTQADFRKISLGLRSWRGPATMVRVLLKRI